MENAEDGPLHRTARKLGALFEQILPPIKTLIKAYGVRVSEISSVCKIDQTVSSRLFFNAAQIYIVEEMENGLDFLFPSFLGPLFN